jgi:hypothetical protein
MIILHAIGIFLNLHGRFAESMQKRMHAALEDRHCFGRVNQPWFRLRGGDPFHQSLLRLMSSGVVFGHFLFSVASISLYLVRIFFLFDPMRDP